MKKLIQLYQYFFQTDCFARAGSLAFTTILALVPLMVVVMNVISWLPIAKTWSSHVQDFIFSNFVASAGSQVLNYLQEFVARVHELSLISILFLMVTAVSMIFSIENSLNAIWQVNVSRNLLKAIPLYLLLLFLGPITILVSMILSGSVLEVLHHLFGLKFLLNNIFKLLPFLISLLGYFFVYKIIPHCYVPWRIAFFSAAISAILFECAKNIFTWYLKMFPTYQVIYGALATVPIFFIWIYICWLIFLMGAMIGRIAYRTH